LTFGFYGLFKKLTSLDSISGLTLETMLTCIFCSSLFKSTWVLPVRDHFISPGQLNPDLFGAGVVTAVPLLYSGLEAPELALVCIGVSCNYISPTMTF
jgi:chloramphenicol-sensitive protein RarD